MFLCICVLASYIRKAGIPGILAIILTNIRNPAREKYNSSVIPYCDIGQAPYPLPRDVFFMIESHHRLTSTLTCNAATQLLNLDWLTIC